MRMLLALLLMFVPVAAQAQGAKASSPLELANAAATLKPGQWVWAPDIAAAGPVIVYVDLGRQLATVYRNGVRVGVTTVSTGKPGHRTPTGIFTILQKDATHRSSKYNDAPMPYQERLTWDGIALHAGGLPGYPESHGCVHLPLEFSKLLFGVTQLGVTVVIAGEPGAPVLLPDAGVLSPVVAGGAADAHVPLATGEAYRWTPEAAPTGPMTIVVSQSDSRIVVSRNGVEIGRARAVLDPPPFGTHAMTLTRDASGKDSWIMVAVPGQDADAGQPIDANLLMRLHLPQGFLASLRPAIMPGTTVLVTQAPVIGTPSGAAMTVLTAGQR